ncbi:molybdopterin-binding protein [Tranquillimonas rosea]|uniref:molybdopterin-binding protein n=1 Tax=Tranquillimonas rosea TaxID=641238 RepID=UPI003BABFC44
MSATFDTVVMVDWSGAGDRGATPKADAIWAGVARDGQADAPVYLRSRAAAEAWLAEVVPAERAAGRRVLLGFDFPFAYPAGTARRITGHEDPRLLWDWFAAAFDALADGEGRFDIAARLNGLFTGDEGPFWFNGLKRDLPGLGKGKPPPQADWPPERRRVETRAPGSFACWQMGGAGAVGSQAMTGMATLSRLRHLWPEAAIWPFDPVGDSPLVIAEVWPSLLSDAVTRRMAEDASLPGAGREGRPIKDAAQVAVLSEALSALCVDGRIDAAFAAAEGPDLAEEGWILGVGGEPELRAAAQPRLRNDCFALPSGVSWTPVDEALTLLRDRLTCVVGTETVPVGAAAGRILAQPHVAARSNPPAANAAVDGYGFAHAALGDAPHRLPLTRGRAAAGGPLEHALPRGEAVRILTGALLPEGVDTVVLEEDTRLEDGAVVFDGAVKPGANTRRAGEDVSVGEVALEGGHALRPPDLALLSALGLAEARVRRRLRVGVLSTGDELAAPGATQDPARTYDANRPMLLALAERWGHAAIDLGHVPDDRAALAHRLDTAGADVILTSGGASAGDEDHVSALLRETGSLTAWRIALKPGRPLALGMWRGMPVFGLPGNPVAAFVCALVFGRPALSVLAGGPWPETRGFVVPAAFEKRKKPGRREYLRARLAPDGRVEVFRSEGSGRISGLSWAEGLVELGDGAAEIRPGDPVTFLPYGLFGL